MREVWEVDKYVVNAEGDITGTKFEKVYKRVQKFLHLGGPFDKTYQFPKYDDPDYCAYNAAYSGQREHSFIFVHRELLGEEEES